MCPTAGTRLRLKPLFLSRHNLNTTEPCQSLKIMTLISEPRSGPSARLALANEQEQSERILGTGIVAMARAAWQREAGGCVVPVT